MNVCSRFKKHLILSLLTTILAVFTITDSHAALQVFPTRLFLNPRKRVSQLTLRQGGDKKETYHISAIFYRMEKDGRMTRVEKPREDERDLLKFVRFSPHEVTLEPNVEQTVKIMTIPSGEIKEGDYRAHILFDPIGEEASSQTRKPGSAEVAMQLTAKMAVAVPVFYEAAPATDFKVELHNLKIVTGQSKKPEFQVEIESSGKKFVYGDIKAWFTKNGSTKPEQVITVNGISSYVPKRTIQYAVNGADQVALKGGKLRMDLNETQEAGGKLLASTEIDIP